MTIIKGLVRASTKENHLARISFSVVPQSSVERVANSTTDLRVIQPPIALQISKLITDPKVIVAACCHDQRLSAAVAVSGVEARGISH
jgi:hypothetical protein